jgi:hypothetical protein
MNNKLIQFSYQISNDEYILLELQGDISHTMERKFNDLYLGRLEKKHEVTYFKLG